MYRRLEGLVEPEKEERVGKGFRGGDQWWGM